MNSTLASFVLRHLLAFAMFVGLPAIMTAMAPVSWIRFERTDGGVTATTKTCLLFVVPYSTKTVAPVTGIRDRFVAGSYQYDHESGKRTKSEDQGFLIIQGPGDSPEIPVTPFNLKSVVARSEAFLNDPDAQKLTLYVVANWKFSVIVGGLLSLLTFLYAVCLTFGIVLKLVHLLQGAYGVSPERRLLVEQLARLGNWALERWKPRRRGRGTGSGSSAVRPKN